MYVLYVHKSRRRSMLRLLLWHIVSSVVSVSDPPLIIMWCLRPNCPLCVRPENVQTSWTLLIKVAHVIKAPPDPVSPPRWQEAEERGNMGVMFIMIMHKLHQKCIDSISCWSHDKRLGPYNVMQICIRMKPVPFLVLKTVDEKNS